MGTYVELFVIGVTASFGPCFVFCSPAVLPYIAATRKGAREGFRAALIFSLARMATHAILGLLAGVVGRLLIRLLHEFDDPIFIVGGAVISLLGLLIILGKNPQPRLCRLFRKSGGENDTWDVLLFGLMMGLMPCLPFLTVLGYIALRSETLWQGGLYGLSFGAGELVSPLILLGPVAGALPAALMKRRVYDLFNRLCGVLLFLVGAQLAVSRVL